MGIISWSGGVVELRGSSGHITNVQAGSGNDLDISIQSQQQKQMYNINLSFVIVLCDIISRFGCFKILPFVVD